MKKIDIEKAPTRHGTGYPAPYDEPCHRRQRWRLGNAAELTQFGVNLLKLPAGAWSSQRHWHATEDEFIYVLEGEVVLASNDGEEVLHAGDCAGFKAGVTDGHHLQNRSGQEAVILEVGTRNPQGDDVDYPDIDLAVRARVGGYVHKDGRVYTPQLKK
ncbi:MAG: cupin domain-containing protein [Gammaproteobacteria bacterium]